jgi:hypothetical protein
MTQEQIIEQVQQLRDMYESLVEQFPEHPLAEFGEQIPDPRDAYDQMELAKSVIELQGITEFLSVHTAPVGNGVGFVVISYPGGETRFRKAIFESAHDAKHFIIEVRDVIHRGEMHWFLEDHPYLGTHRKNKKANSK